MKQTDFLLFIIRFVALFICLFIYVCLFVCLNHFGYDSANLSQYPVYIVEVHCISQNLEVVISRMAEISSMDVTSSEY